MFVFLPTSFSTNRCEVELKLIRVFNSHILIAARKHYRFATRSEPVLNNKPAYHVLYPSDTSLIFLLFTKTNFYV